VIFHASRWILSSDIHRPTLALVISLEMFLSLVFNAFIIFHSIYHRAKSFKRSSTILLFSLALSDIAMALLYMPFTVTTLSFGEWVFGKTDRARSAFCQVHGFVFFYASTVATYVLAVVSADRFLYIVKAEVHHRIMTRKVIHALMTSIWVRRSLLVRSDVLTHALSLANLVESYNAKCSFHSW